MLRVLKFELNRAFRAQGLVYSLLLGCTIAILDFLAFTKEYNGDIRAISVAEAWIGTDYKFAYNILFYIVLPILAALPYAGSYFEDINSGYVKNICVKVSRKNYYTAKYISVFLMAMLAVMVPLVLNMMLCMMKYPIFEPEKLLFLATNPIDRNFGASIYHTNPIWYMLIYTLIDGMFAGIISVFSICVAEYTESYFSNVLIPFVVYIITGMMAGSMGIADNILKEMLNPVQNYPVSAVNFGTHALALVLISVIIINIRCKRKDII